MRPSYVEAVFVTQYSSGHQLTWPPGHLHEKSAAWS